MTVICEARISDVMQGVVSKCAQDELIDRAIRDAAEGRPVRRVLPMDGIVFQRCYHVDEWSALIECEADG